MGYQLTYPHVIRPQDDIFDQVEILKRLFPIKLIKGELIEDAPIYNNKVEIERLTIQLAEKEQDNKISARKVLNTKNELDELRNKLLLENKKVVTLKKKILSKQKCHLA